MNDPDRYDLHNELSPLLLNMEVLINLCLDNDADCSDRALYAPPLCAAWHTQISSRAAP
jgi:hypothetical protein